MRSKSNIFLLTAALSIAAAVPISAADPGFKVVVNASNTTTSISKEQLSRCFMRQTNTWINGTVVLPVDQPATSRVRIDFSSTIHDRDVNAIKSYWQRQIFSGRGVPPPEKATDQDVLTFVSANPGAIGYVSPDTKIGAGIKILEVTGQ